jgi:hypothetical protein
MLTRIDYEGEADTYMPPLWDDIQHRPNIATSDHRAGPAPETVPDHPHQEETAASGVRKRQRRSWKRRTAHRDVTDADNDG